jgi:hypothetical protein
LIRTCGLNQQVADVKYREQNTQSQVSRGTENTGLSRVVRAHNVTRVVRVDRVTRVVRVDRVTGC